MKNLIYCFSFLISFLFLPNLSAQVNLDIEGDGTVEGNLAVGIAPTTFKLRVHDQSDFTVDVSDPDVLRFGNLFSSSDNLRLLSLGSAEISIDDNNNTPGKFFRVLAKGNTELMRVTDDGNVGIGTDNPTGQLHLFGNGFLKLEQSGLSNGEYGEVNASGVGTLRLYQHDSNSYGGIDILPGGNVGIGTASPDEKLHIIGGSDVNGTSGGFLQLGFTTGFNIGIDNNEIQARNNGTPANLGINFEGGDITLSGNAVYVRSSNDFVGIGTSNPTSRLHVNGEATIQDKLVVIGSDFAERFIVNTDLARKDATALQGLLLIIDESSEGQLKPCTQAYDKKVAGIVSGAGGVSTGLVMGEPNTLADGDIPVAMSGRVYCYADASYGAIEVGDLLTTSPTEGHAMKAKKFKKSQGAVIGKAMTALNKGEKGLILVLINAQ